MYVAALELVKTPWSFLSVKYFVKVPSRNYHGLIHPFIRFLLAGLLTVATGLAIAGKLFLTTCFGVVYAVTAEMYPVSAR